MKGVILAGGKGTRLGQLTLVANKHLLPVYNKPMILHPLETLREFGVDDVLIVTGGEYIGRFVELLGDGSDFGVKITYRVQKDAGGIAQALGLAEEFFKGEKVLVILGDNIFETAVLKRSLTHDWTADENAVLFIKDINDPERFGVIEFDKKGNAKIIIEKPNMPKSNSAVTGLYMYPSDVFEIIKKLKPSARGELEITDINNHYIKKGKCKVVKFEGFWSDAGTFDSLLKSANWIKGCD